MDLARTNLAKVALLGDRGLGRTELVELREIWLTRVQETRSLFDEMISLTETRLAETRMERNRDLWEDVQSTTRDMMASLEESVASSQRFIDAVEAGTIDEIIPRSNILDAQTREFLGLADVLDRHIADLDTAARLILASTYRDVNRIILVATLAAFAMVSIIIRSLRWSISQPLRELMEFVGRVGDGDLTRRLRNLGEDEIGRLSTQVNGMVEHIAQNTTRIIDAVSALAGASEQLKVAVTDQAESTTEQSAAIQEISTSLVEMTQTGRQITDRANELAASASETRKMTSDGIEMIAETYAAIEAIAEQSGAVATNVIGLSEKIRAAGEIITTVNDIAERTNILALNAAIEASSAGESGNSFGVVADEMKDLAGQAKEATLRVQRVLEDIQQGIGTSVMQTEEAVKRTDLGKQMSADMRETLDAVGQQFEANILAVEQIIEATRQQQLGVESVTDAVDDIRTSAGIVEEGTRNMQGATSNLNALSTQLRDSIKGYSVA